MYDLNMAMIFLVFLGCSCSGVCKFKSAQQLFYEVIDVEKKCLPFTSILSVPDLQVSCSYRAVSTGATLKWSLTTVGKFHVCFFLRIKYL